MNPYCFIITSFGQKDNIKDIEDKIKKGKVETAVQKINFDMIYEDLIVPALKLAELEPLIEKFEDSLGSIHKTMYEKILLCEFCITDLTNANPNVYYEIGMRYAVKPHTTVPIIASSHFPLPFDINGNRTFTYSVDANFNLNNKDADVKNLAALLVKAKQKRLTDSPLYDMVNGIEFQNAVAHEKTDVFRTKVVYDDVLKEKLAYARILTGEDGKLDKKKCADAIDEIVAANLPLENIETAVLIDIMISYRNVDAFKQMQLFIEQLPRYVFETVMVQEQYAFALNRNGGKIDPPDEVMIAKAENALKGVEQSGKASSETYGIWGRIYKDKFERAYKVKNKIVANAQLKNIVKYYQKGFESDMRDAYPGVNYVTFLEISGEAAKAERIVPVVEYAVKNKMLRKEPDYWDYATLLELAVIEKKYEAAYSFLGDAIPLKTEEWMFTTTIGNLKMIAAYRNERGEDISDLNQLIDSFPK